MVRLNTRGDTLVEVLLAVAVVSSVLGIAYSIMNRNLQIMRNNQERTAASKYAQGQLELLKQAPGSLAPTVLEFCMTDGVPSEQHELEGAGSENILHPELASYNPEAYTNHPECVREGIYRIGVRRESETTTPIYRVYVRWDEIGSGQRREVIFAYKVN